MALFFGILCYIFITKKIVNRLDILITLGQLSAKLLFKTKLSEDI